jgi:D-arabinose 1-dehydrogenase-like Zn-dependent alcohol dehydrogenase
VPLDTILTAIPALFKMAAAGKFHVDVEPVPLAQVEAAWSRVEKGRRIVFSI